MEKILINVIIYATNNFNDNMILGKREFAVVFKGILNGELVCIILTTLDIGIPEFSKLLD